MHTPCPHCGHHRHYGSGDTATCARCHRFIAPATVDLPQPPKRNTPLDRVLQDYDAHGDPWVIRH